MAGFGLINSEWLTVPWEQARDFLKTELESLRLVISRRWASVFSADNTLLPDAILGDKTIVPQYVANTGPKFKPKWDKVDVQNGVKNRLQFGHLVAAAQPSILIGRESGSAGDFEEITPDPTQFMFDGTTLKLVSEGLDYVVASDGGNPPQPMDDGAGSFFYIPYTP